MFENNFIKIFLVLIGVAFLIYRFQLITTIINGFVSWIKGKEKYEADKKKYSKLSSELDDILINDKINKTDKSGITFQLLKIVRNNNQYLVYFSVEGGAVLIDKIISEDINIIFIEPKAYIENNSGGYFSFTKIIPEKNTVEFEIIFEDIYASKHSGKYLLSVSENTLEEIN